MQVAHLSQLATQRISRQWLSRGWNAWKEGYTGHRRKQQLVQRAASQLSRPGLSRVYAWWRNDWRAAVQDHEAAELRATLEHEMVARRELEESLRELHSQSQGSAELMHARLELMQVAPSSDCV